MWGSVEQWSRFADRVAIPVAYTDLDAHIRFANATFERQFDFLPNSAVGHSLWDLLVPAGTTGDLSGRIRKGDDLHFLAHDKSKSEEQTRELMVSCVPHQEADGKVVGCVVVLPHTHEQPESPRSDERRLDAVLATTPDGVLLFDERGVIDTANTAAEQMFGYPAGGLVGRSVHLLIPGASGASNPWVVGTRSAEAIRHDDSRFEAVVSVGVAGKSFAGVIRDTPHLREPEQQAADVADTVRKQIGEELHDNVGQQLTGLELMVDALAQRVNGADPATRTVVTKVAEGLRKVHTDLRQLTTGIIPTEVPADGLVAALDRFAVRIRELSSRKCELVTPKQVQLADAATATHLFRIVQEAVRNAVRHSHANTIWLTLKLEGNALTVEIRDDGGGFSLPPDSPGLGTGIMHDRAARIGGTLTIDMIDGGTVVVVRVPALANTGV